jgi:uncharacterized cupredoxin-like copper-binding protein
MAFTSRLRARVSGAWLAATLAAVMGLVLAACDGAASAPAPTATATTAAVVDPTQPPAMGGDAQTVAVTLKEWAVELPQKELSAGKYKFDVTNTGQFDHNLTIKDSNGQLGRTPNFKSSDGMKPLEVDLQAGTYTFLCDIPGHPEQGMTTEVIVK